MLSINDHRRDSAGMRYIYPVVSRRARGVSIGINLNVNNACNWACIYCQVPELKRGGPAKVDLHQLESELHDFLQEAIVLLEQGRIEFEEMPLRTYLNLSLHLAKAYMLYFEITKEQRFALITQQILKPLTVHEHGDVYFFLAYASACKNDTALSRHWLKKYSQTSEFDAFLLQQHAAFAPYYEALWFIQLTQQKPH